ncbi:MAG TPA: GTP cyclohydrolase I, partial [Dissulfurispiraceae bacterium]
SHSIMKAIDAAGVGVIIEARHLCMMMRGVAKQNSMMITSSLLGNFHDDPATRHEFTAIVTRPKPNV